MKQPQCMMQPKLQKQKLALADSDWHSSKLKITQKMPNDITKKMLGKSRRLINAERHPGACTKRSHTGHQDTCPLWGHSLLKLLFKLKHTQYRIVVAPPVPMSTCVFLPIGCRTLIDTETHTTALTVYISGDTINPVSPYNNLIHLRAWLATVCIRTYRLESLSCTQHW